LSIFDGFGCFRAALQANYFWKKYLNRGALKSFAHRRFCGGATSHAFALDLEGWMQQASLRSDHLFE